MVSKSASESAQTVSQFVVVGRHADVVRLVIGSTVVESVLDQSDVICVVPSDVQRTRQRVDLVANEPDDGY